MPQTGNQPSEQLTLGQFELKSTLLKFPEHSLQPLKVAGWIFGEDDNITWVDDTPMESKVPDASLH